MVAVMMEEAVVKRNDVNVRLDSEVVTDAKMVASAKGVTLAGYLSELLRPLVRRDLEEETGRRLKRGAGGTSGRRPKGTD